MNLWVIFITGLTVGGLSCLAVQGGLLALIITSKEEEEISEGKNTKNPFITTAAFLIAKLAAYTLLGLLLGAFGKAVGINATVQSYMQLLAGIYMILVALNLLEIHPIFRYVIIQPPKFLAKKLRNQSKSKNLFAPALLGAMTIFIPCGTTLAMEALAISSANPFSGALILIAFVLGTIPLFFGIGYVTSILGDTFREKFLKVAAIAIVYLGLTSINGALIALGSPISFHSLFESSNTSQKIASGQNIEIRISSSGYSPNIIRVKKGVPVTLTLTSKNAFSCASAFRIPTLNIAVNLQPNESQKITFTPTQSGQIPFSCSMGMYRGVIEVI